MSDVLTVFTIGHSTHSWEHFLTLLQGANITAVADVRTSPYSRLHPHFNREDLREELRHGGISYVFLGKELGGRPSVNASFTAKEWPTTRKWRRRLSSITELTEPPRAQGNTV